MAQVYGIWQPTKNETDGHQNPMEQWPSMRSAKASLKERLTRGYPNISRCRTWYIDRPRQDDAQFYGTKDLCCIYLYRQQNDSQPYALLEFGPRGGIRQRSIGH